MENGNRKKDYKRAINANGSGDAIAAPAEGAALLTAPVEAEKPRLLKNRLRRMTQCQARRADGRRCRQVVNKGRHLCVFHCGPPDHMSKIARLATEARKKKLAEQQALRRPISSVAEARKLLGVLISEMRAKGEPAEKIVSALATFVKLEEVSVQEKQIRNIELQLGLREPTLEDVPSAN